MIIDLDADYSRKKKEEIEILSTVSDEPSIVIITSSPTTDQEPAKPKASIPDQDRRDFLLEQLELEDRQVRAERAAAHRKYFDLLKPDLTPKSPHTDFSPIYEEIEELGRQLQSIYLRKQQIIQYGEERKLKVLDDAALAKIDALKFSKKRVIDNLYKLRKRLAQAEAVGNQTKIKNATERIDELELKRLEIDHQIKKLENG